MSIYVFFNACKMSTFFSTYTIESHVGDIEYFAKVSFREDWTCITRCKTSLRASQDYYLIISELGFLNMMVVLFGPM